MYASLVPNTIPQHMTTAEERAWLNARWEQEQQPCEDAQIVDSFTANMAAKGEHAVWAAVFVTSDGSMEAYYPINRDTYVWKTWPIGMDLPKWMCAAV